MFLRALACGLDVTGTGRGAELAGDVLELYAERRAARGVVYGLARAAADVSTLRSGHASG